MNNRFSKLAIRLLVAIAYAAFQACSSQVQNTPELPPLFSAVLPDSSGVHFTNTIQESATANILTYQYFYNGGGVAVGDLNGDGLEDLFFTANQNQNKLYLNLGDLKFRDLTLATSTGGREFAWTTGAAIADVNGDGLLDIYVCYSGDLDAESRRNQLFINQGNDADGIPFFKESAKAFGLDDPSYSTSAYFFDMDQDNDLDLLLLNHNPRLFNQLNADAFQKMLETPDSASMTKMFENKEGYFEEVTLKAGLSGAGLSYALGAAIFDVNGDGLQDIYLGNDYSAPDYLYLNQGGGKFENVIREAMGHTSLYTMGVDFGDVNQDGKMDLITLDMLPGDSKRQKLLFSPENYEHYNLFLDVGLHAQHMRNMLQMNLGNSKFSEMGELAGIAQTDWSWTPLFADLDMDGHLDLLVTNGFLKDFTNLDFINYRDEVLKNQKVTQASILELIKRMPATQISNYAYKGLGEVGFQDRSRAWGLDRPGNSNGAAYADLDGDGDLELILNNLNAPAEIYENQGAGSPNWLAIQLNGPGKNPFGIGAKLQFWSEGRSQIREMMPYRGYQGNVSFRIHAAFGERKVDSLLVAWPDGSTSRLISPAMNQLHKVSPKSERLALDGAQKTPLFNLAFQDEALPFRVNAEDFKTQSQLLYSLSQPYELLRAADYTGDGEEDVLFWEPGSQTIWVFESGDLKRKKVIYQISSGRKLSDFAFNEGKLFLSFDAFADESAGFEIVNLNPGGEQRNKFSGGDPVSKFAFGDFDGDGEQELFLGGTYRLGQWPNSGGSSLLKKNQQGDWMDVVLQDPAFLQRVGALAAYDLNQDGIDELISAAEFDRIRVWSLERDVWKDLTEIYLPGSPRGLWSSILLQDVDGDGNVELFAGNWGTNSRLRASSKTPLKIYFSDFDQNGSVDPILIQDFPDGFFPLISRDELVTQLYRKKKQFDSHQKYADASLEQILTKEEIQMAEILEVEELGTLAFTWTGAQFSPMELPEMIQSSPVLSISSGTWKGASYVFLGGNRLQTRLKIGRQDANPGWLIQKNQNQFTLIDPQNSGIVQSGEIRSSLWLQDQLWLSGSHLAVYLLQKPSAP